MILVKLLETIQAQAREGHVQNGDGHEEEEAEIMFLSDTL